jgi:hypothetical protein
LDNQWHDIAMTLTKDTFTFYIDGKSVYTQAITQTQADAIFNPYNNYGLHVGSSGPWKVDPTIRGTFEGNIDNLHIGSVALGAESIAAMHTKNTTVNTDPLAVNHAPFNLVDINTTANVIAEDRQVGADTYITARATDTDAGDRITYSILDNANRNFIIDPDTGVIELGQVLDYETTKSYNITVKATDLSGASAIKTFTLNITDIKDGPGTPKDTNLAVNAVAINSPIGTEVGLTVFAPESVAGKTTYKLPPTADNKYFSIDANTGVVTLTSTPEKTGITNILVQVDDPAGGRNLQFFSINVVDADVKLNTAPINLTDTNAAANIVSEKAAIGSLVGITANAIDPDGTTLTYSLVDNAGGRFAINSTTGEVSVAGAFDYKTATNHNILVRASDGDLSVQKVFNIGITSQTTPNTDTSAPTNLVDNNTATNSIAENAAVGTAVGITAKATDASAISYSLTDSAGGKFAINASTGVVTVASALDYETAASHSITVKATDAGGLSTSQTFAIGVTNVNEAPVNLVDSNSAANTIAENAAVGTVVGITAKSTDTDALTYSLTDSAGGKFAINASTGVVTVASALDYETAASHNITVKATDAGGLSTSQTFAIGVTNVNEAPVNLVDSNSTANSVAENAAVGTAVGITAKATDQDAGNALTYSLSDNAGGKFAINASTGVVTVASALDYETAASHNITVKATDAGGLSTSQTFAIGVTNVNEAPVNLVDSNSTANSVAENAAVGTVVGITAKATDADAGNTLTYSLTDNAGGKFTINASTGVVTVASALDYETAATHNITVKATDAGNLSTSQTFTIGVTNVNEAPTNLVDSNTAANSVAQSAAIGSVVGITAKATDVDASDKLTYSLTDNANGMFAIDATTGVVTVAKALDSAISHNITVKAADVAGLSNTKTFTIGVTDIAQPSDTLPTNLVDTNSTANSVAEDATIGAVVGLTAKATDTTALTYSLMDNADGKFAINATTGVVTVASVLDYETAHSHNITIKATSTTGLSTAQVFTVGVSDVNEAPSDLVDQNTVLNLIAEDAAIGSTVGVTAFAEDLDANDKVTYSLTSNPNNLFAIDADSGVVTLASSALNSQGTHTIVVQATDAAGLSTNSSFTIGVVAAEDEEGINLIGTEGDDIMIGSARNDALSGSMGQDELTGNAGSDALQGNQGADKVFGGEGDDTMLGGKDADLLNGNAGNDTLNGNLGDDIAHGGKGDDVVYGGQGNDRVFGDVGNDTISGDMGRDYLMGGTGSDVFVFARAASTMSNFDTIGDFVTGEDKIDLSSFGYNNITLVSSSASLAVSDPQTLVLQVQHQSDGSTLLTNNNLDFTIKLQGTHEVTTTDFLV